MRLKNQQLLLNDTKVIPAKLSAHKHSGGQAEILITEIIAENKAMAMIKTNHKIIYMKEKLEGLINIPWILLSLLLLISIEWFVRKYNGLL